MHIQLPSGARELKPVLNVHLSVLVLTANVLVRLFVSTGSSEPSLAAFSVHIRAKHQNLMCQLICILGKPVNVYFGKP